MATCLTAGVAVMAGCPFQVKTPDLAQTSSQEYEVNEDNQIEILVTFNAAIDRTTLVPGVNVILETELDPNADIDITAGPTPRTIVITSEAPIDELLEFDPDGFFSLKLLGSGDAPIRSVRGTILDGDKDGKAGGDYTTRFASIG
jgi:hypothetical protein